MRPGIIKLLQRIFILVFPLLLTPVWVWLIAAGHLNLGAGEKDVLYLGPWLLWALLFIVTGAVIWRKYVVTRTWVLRSLSFSFAVLILLWVVLVLFVFLMM